MGILRRYLRAWLILAASIVLVVFMGGSLARSLTTLSGGAAWVAHSESVRFELAQILQDLSDLGAGVTGYAVTHDETLFEPARRADAELEGRMASLRALVAENPAQRPLAARLAELAEQRRVSTREVREVALKGDLPGVQALIGGGESKRLLDASRAVVMQMQSEEGHVLEYHTRATRRARDAVAAGIWVTTALAILLLVAVAAVTVRDAERLRRVEEELAVTEREARQVLIDSSNALREADQRKDVFLATLSHELRNPLAPIRTATRVLETPDLAAADAERSRAIISRQVRHMGALLDDLLDISRINRGVLSLKVVPTPLRSIVEAAIETAEPLITANGHHLEVSWPEQPVLVEGDPLRLTQVVANLLTNAAKYTRRGGHIALHTRADASGITICVRDDGIGIAADMLTKVFDMFSQAPAGRDRADGGLGIGLALVKGFVELHGGRVEARSAGADLGSEFEVSLPASLIVAQAQSAAPEVAAPAPSPRRRILVADDNRDGADILAMLLDQSGYEVRVAYSGAEAYELAGKDHPDAAILDIGMPGMDGYELARRIRSTEWGAATRLIAMTGWGQDEDRRRAQEAGFDHHLTKPVDPGAVEKLLAEL